LYKKSLEDQKMDFLYQYDPVRDTSPVRVLSGGGDFGGTLSRYDINNAYREIQSQGYEGSVYDVTRLLSKDQNGRVSFFIDVENTISYEQIMYYKLLFSEFSALGFIPELTKASKKITFDIGNSNNWGMADMMKYAGFMVGNTANTLTYWNKSHLYNEFWHSTKTRGIATVFNKARWNNSMAIKWRNVQTAPFQGVSKTAGRIVGVGAGGALVLADVALSGELKPSQLVNGIAAGISWTGVGSVVAGVWFVADFGTMGVNYLLGNGAIGLGDMLDNHFGTYEMYEGIY